MERRVAAAKAAGGALMVASAIVAGAMTGMLSPLEIGASPGGEGSASGSEVQQAVAVAPTTPPVPTPPVPTTGAALSVARVPNDWPANTPIPPIPSGCANPVLALNGQWGCK